MKYAKLAQWMQDHRVSQESLGLAVGVTQGMVSRWLTDKDKIAPERVLRVAAFTNWEITPHELDPDLYPSPLDGMPASLLAPRVISSMAA